MRHFIRAVFILISMTSNNALSSAFSKPTEPDAIVKIENYSFEYRQSGSGKATIETAGLDPDISYHSVTLSYSVKQDDLVTTSTIADALKKAAQDKCNDLAESGSGELVSKIFKSSPWAISGEYICAIK